MKADGEIATNDKENGQVFAEHFTKVLNLVEDSNFEPSMIDKVTKIDTVDHLASPPNCEEIKAAILRLKYEKAPGPSGIPTEAFKFLESNGICVMEEIILQLWNDPEFNPLEWSQIKLKVLPKTTGIALQDPNKWRGIALGETAAKLASSIIAHRLTKHVSDFGIDEQCGCLFGKSCADATFSLKTALQTLKEHGKSSYVLFVDLVKAFDSANRELIWLILDRYGVPKQMIDVIKKLHTNATYQFKIGKNEHEIKSTGGVKQGDNLGPILFIILMNAVAETLNDEWDFEKPDFRMHGMNDADGTLDGRCNPDLMHGQSSKAVGRTFAVFSSYFVDDAAYIFLNRRDLERAARMIKEHFKKFGLTVHCGDKRDPDKKSKTEAMFIPASGYTPTPEDTADIMLNEHQYFGFTTLFKYLGTWFDDQLDDSTDIMKRIKKATGAFACMKKVLKDQSIDNNLRVRLYDATVMNIMLYGCESWALKAEDRRKLEVAHHRFVRSMQNITIYDVMDDHSLSNEEVRSRLGCYTLHQCMELRRARWLEKLANMKSTRNPRKILHAWIHDTPRPTGRPKQTIRRALAITLDKSLKLDTHLKKWIPIARNHSRWARHVEQSLDIKKGTYKPFKHRRNESLTR